MKQERVDRALSFFVGMIAEPFYHYSVCREGAILGVSNHGVMGERK